MVWLGASAREPGNHVLACVAIACVLVLDARASAGGPSDHALLHWCTDDGLPAHTITDIELAAGGYLWMAPTAGLIRFDGHRFTVFDQRNAGLTNPRVRSVSFPLDGGIRVVGEDGFTLESRSLARPRFTSAER